MLKTIRFGWESRRAWWFIATARSRERFARTTLGSIWLGISNLLSVFILALVYHKVFKIDDFTSFLLYLGVGLGGWSGITSAIEAAPKLLRSNNINLKNTNIHPIFYTLEEWAFQSQTFFQSFGLLLIAFVPFKPTIFWNLLVFGPLPIVNLLLFMLWIPLLISLLGAEYEDLFQLVPVFLQMSFLLSPILYKKETLGELQWTAHINPFYQIINNMRTALLEGAININSELTITIINLMGITISISILEHRRHKLPFLV